MALTDTFIKNAKPLGLAKGQKHPDERHSDGQGLYLHVKEAGKYWRMSYRYRTELTVVGQSGQWPQMNADAQRLSSAACPLRAGRLQRIVRQALYLNPRPS